MPPDVQLKARLVYYDAIRYSFTTLVGFTVIAVVSALFINGKNLRKTSKS